MADVHLRELLSGSSIALVFKVFGSISTFFFSLLLARNFGATEAGLFFLSLTVTDLMSMLGRFGLAESIIFFVGGNSEQKNWVAVKGAFRKSVFIIVVSSLCAGLLMFLLATVFAKMIFGEENISHIIRIMALAVPALSLLHLFGNSLKGLRLMSDSQFLISLCFQMLFLMLFLPALFFKNIIFVCWAFVAAAWWAAGWGFYLWNRRTPQLRRVTGEFNIDRILTTALPLFLTNILMVVNARAGTFLLGVLSSPHEVGIFNIVLRISMLTNFMLLAVTAICTPKFAALHASGDKMGLALVARQSTLLILATTLPILLVIILYSESILKLFGNDFSGNGHTLMVLTIGQCINVSVGPVGMLLAMTGNATKLRNIYFYFTPINILLQLALIPALGAIGAAWATTLSVIGVNMTAAFLIKKYLGFFLIPIPNERSKY